MILIVIIHVAAVVNLLLDFILFGLSLLLFLQQALGLVDSPFKLFNQVVCHLVCVGHDWGLSYDCAVLTLLLSIHLIDWLILVWPLG